jgi:hypothetical protein
VESFYNDPNRAGINLREHAMDATVKGTLFIGMKKGIEKYFFETGFEQVIAQIPEAHREVWSQPLYPVTRMPADIFRSFAEAVLTLWGDEKFGKIVAELAFADLNAAMRFFLKIGTPSFIAPRFPTIFRQYFSEGDLKILQLDKTSLDMELSNAQAFGRGCCHGTLAWVRMALEYSGAKNMKADHDTCIFKSGTQCLFHYKWE